MIRLIHRLLGGKKLEQPPVRRKERIDRNRSRAEQQGGGEMPVMVSRDGFRQPREDIALLAAAGFNHRQHPLDKVAAVRRLGAKRKLTPDHRVAQRLFRRVVGRFDAVDFEEGPQAFAIRVQFLAKAVRAPVEVAAQQVALDPPTDRFHAAAKSRRDSVPSRTCCHMAKSATLGDHHLLL